MITGKLSIDYYMRLYNEPYPFKGIIYYLFFNDDSIIITISIYIDILTSFIKTSFIRNMINIHICFLFLIFHSFYMLSFHIGFSLPN